MDKEISGAQQDYAEGVELLRRCQEKFSADDYRRGVELLIAAFSRQYEQTRIFQLLFEMIYQPNREQLEACYEGNRAQLSARTEFSDLPPFAKLPFYIFPVRADCFYLFDIRRRFFWDDSHVERRWRALAALALQPDAAKEAPGCLARLRDDSVNRRARALFAEVKSALECGRAEASLYRRILQYHALRPQCERYEWLLGKYYVNGGDLLLAEKWVGRGLKKRRLNFSLLLAAAQICERLGKLPEAAAFCTLTKHTRGKEQEADIHSFLQSLLQKAAGISQSALDAVLRKMSLAETNVLAVPTLNRLSLPESGAVIKQDVVLRLGEFLEGNAGKNYFVGVYNKDHCFDGTAYWTEAWNSFEAGQQKRTVAMYRFDFLKGELTRHSVLNKETVPYLIPLMPTEEKQAVYFTYNNQKRAMRLGRYESSFFRIAEDVEISSESPLLLGEKIYLRHHPKRRRLILNILIDSLSGSLLKREDFSQLPRVKRFFEKGTIFSNAYAAGEWTYPSLAAIETGLYQQNTQIFHPRAQVCLADDVPTLSQRYKAMGYYCVNLVAVPEGVYNGVSGGYDRMVMNLDISYAGEGVERAIQHLTAFKETDNFVNLHFSDVHPPYFDSQADVRAQAEMSLDTRFAYNEDVQKTSVRRRASGFNRRLYDHAASDTDRNLGELFDFIEENYSDDEILVTLYSDHGNSMVSEDEFLLSDEKTGVALMMRGADVPGGGTINDEMVGLVDLYSIWGHLTGYCAERTDGCLPRVFGGAGREYTITQSIFPGQEYFLCIRTARHEFRLRTKDAATGDGRINMDQFTWSLYRRKPWEKVMDSALREYFFDIAYRHTASLHDPVGWE